MIREQSEQSTYDSKNIGIHLVQTKIDKDWNVDSLAWEMPLPRLATAWPEVAQVSIPARSFGKDGLDLLLKSQHLQPLSLLHLLHLSLQISLNHTFFISRTRTIPIPIAPHRFFPTTTTKEQQQNQSPSSIPLQSTNFFQNLQRSKPPDAPRGKKKIQSRTIST